MRLEHLPRTWARIAVPALRGRPVAVRLAAMLLLPIVAAVWLCLDQVVDARHAAEPLDRAAGYARVSHAAVTAIEALEDERDAAAAPPAGDSPRVPLPAAQRSDRALSSLSEAAGAVDDTALRFTRADLEARLAGLTELRRAAFGELSATTTVSRYGAIVLEIIQLGRAADSRTAAVSGRTAGVYDLVSAAGLASQRRAVGTAMLARGRALTGERTILGSFGLLVRVQTDAFRSAADPGTLATFEAADVQTAAGSVDLLAQRVNDRASEVPLDAWVEAATRHLERLWRVIRDAVGRAESDVDALAAARAADTRRSVGVMIVVLLAALLPAAVIGRGLIGDLRRLRDTMTGVDPRRPLVTQGRQLHRRFPAGRDEIGQVARAFEAVHAETVRLAAAHARLRDAVAGLSLTLTRRVQFLIARQLTVLTELEKREVDPDGLHHLFELDHLATRIRRHSDSLLVLIGAAPAWQWPRTAALPDVVRSAAAATEEYRRVEVAPLPPAGIVDRAVVDVIQILAELIDNAARFSGPDQPVRVTGGELAEGGVRLEIRDDGHGLGRRTAATLNARLGNPTLDGLGDESSLGLHVVAALAARTGIGVHLQPLDRGVVASVVVPARLLVAAPAPRKEMAGQPV